MRSQWTLALLVIATALAGCTSDEEPPADDEPEFKGLEATQKTGVIRGLVVDATITPIAGVEVLVEGGSFVGNATSDAEGLFGFSSLPPGEYRVEATKPGYAAALATTTVVAGDARPPIVKVLMEADASSLPYVQAYKFDGFIECSGSFVLVGFAACDTVPDSNDHFLEEYQLDGPPTWVQSEMVWKSTQGVSPELTMLYSRSLPEQTLLDNWEEAAGTSPQVLAVNETRIEEVGLGSNITLMIRVFNQHNEGTAPEDHAPDPLDGDDCYDRPVLGGCLRGLGATVQQEFTIFTHAFYGYEPPEGWLFHESDEVPGP